MTHPSENRTAWIRRAMAEHESALVAYATHLLGDAERGRDVAQDTFMRLCEADRARVDGHLAPWLFRVCRNRALDVAKKEGRTRLLDAHEAERRPDGAPTPRDAATGAEAASSIGAAIDALPPVQQEVIRLKFQHSLTYQEIADVTGHNRNHVRYLIHRAFATLRETLGGCEELHADA